LSYYEGITLSVYIYRFYASRFEEKSSFIWLEFVVSFMSGNNLDGTLITVEGIDKAGKTTVFSELESEFPSACITTEPNEESSVGKEVRSVLSGDAEASEMATFSMFLVDHLNHIETKVGPELERGNTVLCDRYLDSRYAYQQVALNGEIDQSDELNWIKNLHEGNHTTTIKPDMTILLDISVGESLRRKGDDPAEKFETRQFLEQVNKNYHRLAAEEPDRYFVIDAERSKEEVKEEVIHTVKEKF
jgi:dTMP kinase